MVQINRFVLFTLMFLFLFSYVSALELNPFADKKAYEPILREDTGDFLKESFNEKYGVIRFSKTLLWVETDKLAEYSLIENTEQCLINCEAYGKAILYKDGKLFDDLNFINRRGISLDVNAKYLIKTIETYEVEVPDTYKEVCEKAVSNETKDLLLKEESSCYNVVDTYKNETREREIWVEYKGEDLKAGNYEWKVVGFKSPTQAVDFIPTARGKTMNEWAWWNGDWKFKREIKVKENSGSALSNYSVALNITYDSNMNPDFSDLRFTNSTENGELSYWIESKIDSNWAYIWVKIPTLTASQNTSIYMYYKNIFPVITTSSFNNAFVFADDFESSLNANWLQKRGVWSTTGGYLTKSTTTDDIIVWNASLLNLFNYTVTVNIDNSDGIGWEGVAIRTNNNADYYSIQNNMGNNAIAIEKWSNNAFSSSLVEGTSTTTGNMNITAKAVGTNISFYENGVYKISTTDGALSSGSVGIINYQIIKGKFYWIKVQPYTSVEPTYTIGAEKQNIAITLVEPINNTNLNNSLNYFVANLTDESDLGIQNVSLVINNTIYDTNTSGDTGIYNFSETLSDGFYEWYIEAYDDTDELYESETRYFTIDTLAPSIEILSPVTSYNYLQPNQTIDLNVTVTDASDHLDSVWYYYPIEELYETSNLKGTALWWDFKANTTSESIAADSIAYTDLGLNQVIFETGSSTQIARDVGVNPVYENPQECLTKEYYNSASISANTWNNGQDVGKFICLKNDGEYYLLELLNNFRLKSYSFEPQSIEVNGTGFNSTQINYIQDLNSLTVYANDTFGNERSESVSWDYEVLQGAIIYDNVSYEGLDSDFYNFITLNGAIQGAYLEYGNTNYTSSIYLNNNTFLYNQISLPNIEADVNNTFFWWIKIGNEWFQTISNVQLVKAMEVTNCTTSTLLSLNLKDEKLQTSLNGTLEVLLNVISQSGTEVFVYNNTFTNKNNVQFCLSPVDLDKSLFRFNAQIKYSSTDYASELYNIQDAELSDYPQNLSLYDLANNQSTKFKITYKGSDFIPKEGVLVQLLRKYIGGDSYKVVEAPITSSLGEVILHIDQDTNLYNIIISRDGEVLDTYENIVFTCDTALVGLCTFDLDGVINPYNEISTDILNDITFQITELNDTNVMVTFSSISGTPVNVRLLVKENSIIGESYIYNNSLYSSAGSFNVILNDDTNMGIGENVYLFIFIKDDEVIGTKSFLLNNAGMDWDNNNYFIVVILLLSVVGMAFTSPELVIFNGVLTFLIAGSLWLLNGMSFAVGLGSLIWLVIASGILIFKLSHQEDR